VTRLSLACENKNDALVERLLSRSEANAAIVTGETALMTAVVPEVLRPSARCSRMAPMPTAVEPIP